MANDELGVRLSLKGRVEMARGLRQTRQDVADVGEAAEKIGKQAERGAKGVAGAFERTGRGAKGLLGAFDGLGGKLGARLDGVSSSLKAKASAGFAVAGAAGAAALVQGFSAVLDAEASGDRLAARLDLDPAVAAKAGRVGAGVYRQAWGDSLESVNDALAGVGTNLADLGRTSEADLGRITTGVLAISDAFGEDSSAITRAAGTLSKNFGVDATRALDLLTVGFQRGGNYAGDLLDTVSEYSQFFGALGFSGEQFFSGLIEGAKTGTFNVDKIGDALKEFQIRSIDGSDTTREAFRGLGLDAAKLPQALAAGGEAARGATRQTIDALMAVEDPLKRNQLGVALFGTQWEDVGPQVVSALNPVGPALDGVAGATDRMTATLGDNAASKVESFKRTMTGGVVDFLGNQVIPMIERNSTAFAIAGGVIGPLVGGFAALTAGTWLLNAAMAANPVGAVVVGLVALGVGLAVAWQKSETFRNVVTDVFSVVKEGALRMAAVAVGAFAFLVDKFLAALEWITRAAAGAFGWVPGIGDKLKDAARSVEGFRDDANTALAGVQTRLEVEADTTAAERALSQLERRFGLVATVDYVPAYARDAAPPGQRLAIDASAPPPARRPGGAPPASPPSRPPAAAVPASRARALGGPVTAGVSYLVGEHRPELFVPKVDGVVLPRVPAGVSTGVDTAGVAALAAGAVVRARPPLGTLARIGEGRHDEAVLPLPRGLAPERLTTLLAPPAAATPTVLAPPAVAAPVVAPPAMAALRAEPAGKAAGGTVVNFRPGSIVFQGGGGGGYEGEREFAQRVVRALEHEMARRR